MAEDVRPVWSEEELDRALAALNADQQPDKDVLLATRANLMAAAGVPAAAVPARRRWPRLAGAAAAIVAVAAGVLVFQSGGENAPTAAAAALNTAADNIKVTDPVLEPGQYRYIATHAWNSFMTQVDDGRTYEAMVKTSAETWVPSDWREEWLERRSRPTFRWLRGTEEEALAAGASLELYSWPSELRAPCGDFFAEESGDEPCSEPGMWQDPTPEFFDSLPRDPTALYERLHADVEDRGEDHIVVFVADALRSGLIPADLRASLYRVLAMVPGLEITEKVANLDGKQGIAFGIEDDIERQDVIIDPATGEFIGERRIAIAGREGIPSGTVVGYSSVSTAVVDAQGEKPAG